MTEEQFWKLIKQSKRGTEDCEEQTDKLILLLTKLEPKEIIEFDRYFFKRKVEAYRWDLWAVAYIINGGCSDDGFEYFQGWLIAQGKEFFESVLKNPEHAAKKVRDGEEVECESILYSARSAYQEKTGEEMPSSKRKYPPKPKVKVGRRMTLRSYIPNYANAFSREQAA